mgnify:FL=1
MAQKVREKAQEEGKSASQYIKDALQAQMNPKAPSSGLIIPYDSVIYTRIGMWKDKFDVTSDLEALERATRRASIEPDAKIFSEIEPAKPPKTSDPFDTPMWREHLRRFLPDNFPSTADRIQERQWREENKRLNSKPTPSFY